MKTKPRSLFIAQALLAGVHPVKHLSSLPGAAPGALRRSAARFLCLASLVALACSISRVAVAESALVTWNCGPYYLGGYATNLPPNFLLGLRRATR